MKAITLCTDCRKRYKAILRAYGVTDRAMHDKRSIARGWGLIIKEALNGLCWCSGGKCKGTSLPPPRLPPP